MNKLASILALLLLFNGANALGKEKRPIKAQCPFGVGAIMMFQKIDNHYPATLLPDFEYGLNIDPEEPEPSDYQMLKKKYKGLYWHLEWRDLKGVKNKIAECVPGPMPPIGQKFRTDGIVTIEIPQEVDLCISDMDDKTRMATFLCY